MNKHNPKRVAVAVLVAGVALAAVAIKQSAAGDGSAAPVLAEIPSSLESSPADGEVMRSYSVTGMCCESCTRKLHDKVLGMQGVEACAVDLIEERVVLIAKGDVTSKEILSTLNFDKYSAVELSAGS